MSKERNEKRVHRDSRHNRDILADANYTILKIQHFEQSQENLRESSFKKKLGNNVKSIFGQRRYGKIHKSIKIIENNVESRVKEFRDDFQTRLKTRKDLEFNKLNSRIEQLKKRILPSKMEGGKQIQFKLKEIIDINNNESTKNSKNIQYYSEQSSPNSKCRKNMFEQTDYKQIQREFWQKLAEEVKLQPSTVNAIRSNRINLLMRKTIDSEEDLEAFNRIQSTYHKRYQNSLKTSQSTSFFQKKEESESKLRHSTTLNSSFKIQSEKSKSIKDNANTNELAEWEMIRYLKQKEKRKNFVNSISKQLIQNEQAVKIYSLVKGGYPLDQSEVEGEFISLTRFNQARSQFATLNWMYKTVKGEVSCKSIKNEQIQKENFNHSFKRLVQINELSQKMPKNQLQKLMKTSKIVT